MRLGGGVELTYVGGRSFAHDGHQPLDRLQDARHTPKCKRRRAESNDLPVVRPLGPVDILRDQDHIPHIYAQTKADALYGLGYVHAQDRLWQMEFQRRIGFGRLSEVFGSVTVPQDRFLRTVGFGRAARSAWDHLPDD